MGYYADTVEVDFCIPPENIAAAVVAAALAVGEHADAAVDCAGAKQSALAAIVEDATSFEGCEEGPRGFLLGWHGDKYLSRTDELLAALAPWATEGSYVRFHGEDGSLFGYRVLEGRLREESGDYTWTLDAPRPSTNGLRAV